MLAVAAGRLRRLQAEEDARSGNRAPLPVVLGSEQDQHDWGTGQEGKRLGGGSADVVSMSSLKINTNSNHPEQTYVLGVPVMARG